MEMDYHVNAVPLAARDAPNCLASPWTTAPRRLHLQIREGRLQFSQSFAEQIQLFLHPGDRRNLVD
jgi:hypothetical protein